MGTVPWYMLVSAGLLVLVIVLLAIAFAWDDLSKWGKP